MLMITLKSQMWSAFSLFTIPFSLFTIPYSLFTLLNLHTYMPGLAMGWVHLAIR